MPVEVTIDRAPVYPGVIEEFAPQARHGFEPYANNIVEAHLDRLICRNVEFWLRLCLRRGGLSGPFVSFRH